MEKKSKKYYTIGEVSELIQVPTSALRYYDNQGLLSPAARNSDTNYRYYTETQVMRAMMISEMRRIGFTVQDIREQLDSRDLIKQLGSLTRLNKELKDELAHIMFKESYIRTLMSCIDRGLSMISTSRIYGESNGPVYVKYLPGTFVIKVPVEGNFYEQERFARSQRSLYDIADSYSLQITGTAISRFCNQGMDHFSMSSYQSEWLLPIQDSVPGCMNIDFLQEQWCICSAHVGSYENISETYKKVLDYAEEHGIEITGNPLEDYIMSCAHTCGAENYVTEVMFPIALK